MASDAVVIELSLPPKELSPNGRYHWRRRMQVTRAYREAAKWKATLAQTASYDDSGQRQWKSATVLAEFYFPDKRRRDRDNLLASLKAVFDGLADAGVVDDDAAFTYMPVLTAVDRSNPRVVLTVTEGSK